MRAYLSAPLFSEAERAFNRRVDQILRSLGLHTYLPQRDNHHANPAQVFATDCAAILDSELLVFVLDGCVPDEGTCVELGMAYTLHKPCFGLQTDRRRAGPDPPCNNLMITYTLTGGLAHSLEDLATVIRTHKTFRAR